MTNFASYNETRKSEFVLFTKGGFCVGSESHRYRITIPDSDKAVLDWIAVQENLSLSIRFAIKLLLQQEDGQCKDVFSSLELFESRPEPKRRVGRPRVNLSQLVDQTATMLEHTDDEVSVTDDVVEEVIARPVRRQERPHVETPAPASDAQDRLARMRGLMGQ